jgi:GDPmannose 4,6-dehydratase
MKKALITGITGQDGYYLSKLLLENGYDVHGLVRRSSTPNTSRLTDHLPSLILHYGDVTDGIAMGALISQIQPDEVYNLAAQSHVRISFDTPAYTFNVVADGALNLLEAIRRWCPAARFYQASSSEMFGLVQETPQTEKTPFYPRSPYGCAKLAAHWLTKNYRESYNLHASSGILFNHESPLRGENFVTRKISMAAAAIKLGRQSSLTLGNIKAMRDWGYAGDYVRAMWLMLQQDQPDDYVIATGILHSVEDFANAAFLEVDLNWDDYCRFNANLLRPAEVELLVGDSTKARNKLKWFPEVTFGQLVRNMVEHDLNLLSK